MEAKTARGEFWRAGYDDHRVQGALRWGGEGEPILEVSGELSAPRGLIGDIWGQTTEGKVTLIQARSIRTQKVGRAVFDGSESSASSLQDIACTYLIMGSWFSEGLRELVGEVRMRFTHLDDWVLSSSAYKVDIERRTIEAKIFPENRKQIDASSTISIEVAEKSPRFPHPVRGVQIGNRSYLVAAFDKPRPLGELWQALVSPTANFLSTVTGSHNFLTEMQIISVATGGEDNIFEEVQVKGSSLQVFSEDIRTGQDEVAPKRNVWAHSSEVGLEVLGGWLAKSPDFGPTPSIALSSLHGEGFLENQILQAASSIEGLDRRLHPSKSSDLDYDGRIRRLIAIASGGCGPLLPSNVHPWVRAIVKARNSYAHWFIQKRENDNIDVELFVLTQAAAYLTLISALVVSGADPQVIARLVGQDQHFENIVNMARRELPKIYP